MKLKKKQIRFSRAEIIRSDAYWIETLSNALWRRIEPSITGSEADIMATNIFNEDLKPILDEIINPKHDPGERLKNKLSPFTTLAEILIDHDDEEFKPFKEEGINTIFKQLLQTCKENLPQIHEHLNEVQVLYNKDTNG